MTFAAALCEHLESMASMPGLQGCALVELETGLVLQSAGAVMPVAAEAARDYWRLHERHSRCFDHLGAMQAQVMVHAQQRLTLVTVGQGLLLLTFSDTAARVDWAFWQTQLSQLRGLVQTP